MPRFYRFPDELGERLAEAALEERISVEGYLRKIVAAWFGLPVPTQPRTLKRHLTPEERRLDHIARQNAYMARKRAREGQTT